MTAQKEKKVSSEKIDKIPLKKARKNKPAKIKVVFVCTGNTCRSPMAEFIFKEYLKSAKKSESFHIVSRGLSAVDNEPINPLAEKVLTIHHVKCTRHLARNLTKKEAESADAIICMTQSHKSFLADYPNAVALSSVTKGKDVADPYGGSEEDYERTFEYLSYACMDLYEYFSRIKH